MVNSYERLLKRKHADLERKIRCKRCSKGEKLPGCHKCKIKKALLETCGRCCKDRLTECRCRQGRNHASREKELERRKLTVDQMNCMLEDYFIRIDRCGNCDGDIIDYDEVTGDTICATCGLVLDTNNIADAVEVGPGTLVKINKSKAYRTVVYVREKLRGLLGTDPPIWFNEWEMIMKHILFEYGDEWFYHLWSMGQKMFSAICRKVAVDAEGFQVFLAKGEVAPPGTRYPLANKKYGERWIQARMRMGYPGTEKMSLCILANICMKIEIYEMVHKDVFRNNVTKKNTLNLNYVLLQIIRMEDEEEFHYWKRYIKLAVSKLEDYNEKWRTILLELAVNYDYYYNKEMDITFQIQWKYIPMYAGDLYIPKHEKFI
jgi:hypothetical protein